jgi:hypothetical protein
LPRVELTQRQILSDAIADSQYTYILCDAVDESAPDESDIATSTKLGRVMIGSGIEVENGKISVPTPVKASTEVFGVVKAGSGIDVDEGVISVPPHPHADHENFGAVKLSADFKTGDSGELLLANRKNVEEIIYQAASVDVVFNNCIIPKPDFVKYRLFINEDSLITFDWSEIIIEKDLAFDLEIISDASYVISFDANIAWTLPCAGVSAGKTLIHFERKYGSTILYGNMTDCDYHDIADLMINDLDDIQKDLVCGTNGCVDNLSYVFSVRSVNMHDGGYTGNSSELVILYVDFMRSTFVDYIKLWKGFGSSLTVQFFVVEASVDGKNWTVLLKTEPGAQVLENTLYLTKKGHFRHYRLRFAKEITIRGFKFYGFYIDDELFELKKITPIMTANSLNGYSITSSGTNAGALFNLTANSISSYANFSTRDADGKYWIKYELPEPEIVNFVDIASHKDEANRFPLWFKIEASNDGGNWTLLLERAALTYWNGAATKQYYLQNNSAYKFYKFTPLELASTEFRLARFRLYQKVAGKETIQGYIPVLSSASQGGYEVSRSSATSSEAYYAFDGNDGTRWVSAAGSAQNSWIQIKFPTETVCNSVLLKTRNDEYYAQAANSFEIQGSTDGSVFSVLKTVFTSWTQGEEKIISFFNDTPFLYYRIFINTVQDNGSSASFSTINFGTSLREYKRELTVKEYLLPIMNANSRDGYEVSASSEYDSSWQIWRAFDRNTANSWSTKYDSSVATILISMPTAKVCNLISVYPRSGYLNQAFGSFSLFGSSDGDNWTELLTVSGISAWSNNVEKTWDVENDLAFLRYKIVATPFDGSNCVSANNISLFYKSTTLEY